MHVPGTRSGVPGHPWHSSPPSAADPVRPTCGPSRGPLKALPPPATLAPRELDRPAFGDLWGRLTRPPAWGTPSGRRSGPHAHSRTRLQSEAPGPAEDPFHARGSPGPGCAGLCALASGAAGPPALSLPAPARRPGRRVTGPRPRSAPRPHPAPLARDPPSATATRRPPRRAPPGFLVHPLRASPRPPTATLAVVLGPQDGGKPP